MKSFSNAAQRYKSDFPFTGLDEITTGETTELTQSIEYLFPDSINTGNIVIDETEIQDYQGEDPIVVRRSLDTEGNPLYEVIYGAHVVEAERRKGTNTEAIPCWVLGNCPDELFYDLRIIGAQQRPRVKIANTIFSTREAFFSAKWSHRLSQKIYLQEINVAQALGLFVNDTNGELLGLREDETQELKFWVQEKIHRWGVSLERTRELLRIAEMAEPYVISLIREARGGRTTTLPFNKFGMIVSAYPYNGEKQIEMAHRVIEENPTMEMLEDIIRTDLNLGTSESIGYIARRAKKRKTSLKESETEPESYEEIVVERSVNIKGHTITITGLHIDEKHVATLVEKILHGGNPEKVQVRVVTTSQGDTYEVLTGAHTLVALGKLQKVRRNLDYPIEFVRCENEDFYLQRIIEAKNVTTVSFINILLAVSAALKNHEWQSTKIGKRIDEGKITVIQAFYLARSGSSGRSFDITPEESSEIRNWIYDMSKKIGISHTIIYSWLKTANRSKPVLPYMVGTIKNTHGATSELSASMLTVIVGSISDLHVQEELAKFAKANEISLRGMTILAKKVARAIKQGEEYSIEQIYIENKAIQRHKAINIVISENRAKGTEPPNETANVRCAIGIKVPERKEGVEMTYEEKLEGARTELKDIISGLSNAKTAEEEEHEKRLVAYRSKYEFPEIRLDGNISRLSIRNQELGSYIQDNSILLSKIELELMWYLIISSQILTFQQLEAIVPGMYSAEYSIESVKRRLVRKNSRLAERIIIVGNTCRWK